MSVPWVRPRVRCRARSKGPTAPSASLVPWSPCTSRGISRAGGAQSCEEPMSQQGGEVQRADFALPQGADPGASHGGAGDSPSDSGPGQVWGLWVSRPLQERYCPSTGVARVRESSRVPAGKRGRREEEKGPRPQPPPPPHLLPSCLPGPCGPSRPGRLEGPMGSASSEGTGMGAPSSGRGCCPTPFWKPGPPPRQQAAPCSPSTAPPSSLALLRIAQAALFQALHMSLNLAL